jgi:hypothetical protein
LSTDAVTRINERSPTCTYAMEPARASRSSSVLPIRICAASRQCTSPRVNTTCETCTDTRITSSSTAPRHHGHGDHTRWRGAAPRTWPAGLMYCFRSSASLANGSDSVTIELRGDFGPLPLLSSAWPHTSDSCGFSVHDASTHGSARARATTGASLHRPTSSSPRLKVGLYTARQRVISRAPTTLAIIAALKAGSQRSTAPRADRMRGRGRTSRPRWRWSCDAVEPHERKRRVARIQRQSAACPVQSGGETTQNPATTAHAPVAYVLTLCARHGQARARSCRHLRLLHRDMLHHQLHHGVRRDGGRGRCARPFRGSLCDGRDVGQRRVAPDSARALCEGF